MKVNHVSCVQGFLYQSRDLRIMVPKSISMPRIACLALTELHRVIITGVPYFATTAAAWSFVLDRINNDDNHDNENEENKVSENVTIKCRGEWFKKILYHKTRLLMIVVWIAEERTLNITRKQQQRTTAYTQNTHICM